MRKVVIIVSFLFLFLPVASSQNISWPKVTSENKAAIRWWWIGNAVNKEGIAESLKACADAGIGTVEITPVQGEKGNTVEMIDFLSPKWMEMFAYAQSEATRQGIKVTMDLGTGFSLGGPDIKMEDVAGRVFFQEYNLAEGEKLKSVVIINEEEQRKYAVLNRLMAFSSLGERLDLSAKVDKKGNLNWVAPKGDWKLIAVFYGKTLEKVKEAAPGGEGYMLNCFSRKAVSTYLDKLEKAFNTRLGEYAFKSVTEYYRGINDDIEQGRISYPFYFVGYGINDSKAGWTSDFLEQFALRRGYKLEDYLPKFLNEKWNGQTNRLVTDYRKTLEEIFKENFIETYTGWTHKQGSRSIYRQNTFRDNPLDLLAVADIPACGTMTAREKLKGKWSVIFTDMDSLKMKWVSSAAHLMGRTYASAEAFTALEQPFNISLSQCKPLVDQMFVAGINRISINGMSYTPVNEKWPGWQYKKGAALSVQNSIWRDAPAFFNYIARCQSFLQTGKPDNNFLLYLSEGDKETPDVQGSFWKGDEEYLPSKWKGAIREIENCGYKADGISDNFILSARCIKGKIITKGGTSYQAIIVPEGVQMPVETLSQLVKWAEQGAKIIFINKYPENISGYESESGFNKRWEALVKMLPDAENFKKIKSTVLGKGRIITGNNYAKLLKQTEVYAEEMSQYGIQWTRRWTEQGYCYFITSPATGVKDWVSLGVNAMSAAIYDPVTGESGKAKIKYEKGRTKIWLDIMPEQSFIIKTWNRADVDMVPWRYMNPQPLALSLDNGWKLHFVNSQPQINGSYFIDHPVAWTDLAIRDASHTMATGIYSLVFELPEMQAHDWVLDLEEVHESACIRINDQEVATVWSYPFRVSVGRYLRPGSNQIDIEVTNIPLNRLKLYRQQGMRWYLTGEENSSRHDRNAIVKSGLAGKVKLIPMNYE